MSVNVIDTIKPKNGGSFPVVEAADVSVGAQRLPAALDAKANASDIEGLATKAELAVIGNAVDSKAEKTDIIELRTVSALKANQSSLDATNAVVSMKAAQSSLDALSVIVDRKADKRDYDSIFEAIDTKADITAVDTIKRELDQEDENLQAQIDQIVISASAESVVAPEVAAARVGADGESYETLKQRLDAETEYSSTRVNQKQPVSLKGTSNLLNTAVLKQGYYYDPSQGGETASSGYSYFTIELTANQAYRFGAGVKFISQATGELLFNRTNDYRDLAVFEISFTPTETGTYYVTFYNWAEWVCCEGASVEGVTPYQLVDSIDSSENKVESFVCGSQNLLNTAMLATNTYYDDKSHNTTVYSCFRKISVERGKTYVLNFTARFVTYFDTDGEYIDTESNVNRISPESDGYVFISVSTINYNINELICAESDADFSKIVPYGKELTRNLVCDEISDVAKSSVWEMVNMIDFNETSVGYIDPDGSLVTTEIGVNYFTTDFIRVKSGCKYRMTPVIRKLLAFTSTKEIIDGSYINNAQSNYLFTATQDGYVRVSFSNDYSESAKITQEYSPENGYKIPEGVHASETLKEDLSMDPEIVLKSNPLYGKKWCAIGDSFTYGGYSPMNTIDTGIYAGSKKTYPYFVGNRTGLNIVDFSKGGKTLAFPANPDTFTNSITCPTNEHYYQNVPLDADYITIYLGINDSHHASGGGDGEDPTGYIPLGTIDDATVNSFGGAWNVVLSYLIENRPKAHIGIIVSNGCDSNDYRELTIAIAKKYGLPYIDLNGDQTTPAMIRTTNPDIPASVKQVLLDKWKVSDVNGHPNDDAHEFESRFIEEFLYRI